MAREDLMSVLRKNLNDEVADEICTLILQRVEEKIDPEKIQAEITQHIVNHIERDLTVPTIKTSGPSTPTKNRKIRV